MPKRRYLLLNDEQRVELERVRDHDGTPHLREKAAVLLKIAAGMSPHQAAQQGGLKAHQANTIYQWLDWYEADGITGLHIRAGRGRKAAFFPSARDSGAGESEPVGGAAPGTSPLRS